VQLQRAGVVEADAERLARESGGRLATLQSLLGHVVTPDWVVSADLPGLLNRVARVVDHRKRATWFAIKWGCA